MKISFNDYFLMTHVIFLIFENLEKAIAKHSFIASFQSDGSWSTDHWMKFNRKISNVKNEFTMCHWEKLRYFAPSINVIWSYCYTIPEFEESLNCWVFYQSINMESAGRKVDFIVRSESWSMSADAIQYRHRKWNHICFSYSVSKKIGRIYYNGNLAKEVAEGNFTRFENGLSVFQSSFDIGQEQDIIGGGYDPAQLFNGEISEFNMWNTLISEEEIRNLAKCMSTTRGNVIAWNQTNFKFNKIDIIDVLEHSLFCEKRKQLVVFPEKKSFQRAKSLCNIHGGKLALPYSKQEENEILDLR